jgi:UDP-glucose 4-epimerase
MRILITGGFGYLGGRLAQFLSLHSDNEILLGSRVQQKVPKWLPQSRVVQTTWDSQAGLNQICAGVDAVVHLAGMNAKDCMSNPVAAFEVNAVATARLLKAAVRQNVKRFVYISTMHVYSSPLSGVITENTCPTSIHPYATSHRAGEDVIRAANQSQEIEGVVVRLSNAYGAPAHKDADCWMLVVNDLCRQAVLERHITLESSGVQRRNFIPMQDVCRAIDHLMRLSSKNLHHTIFNVGGIWSPTLLEMAELIQERCALVFGFEAQITQKKLKINEVVSELDYRFEYLRQTGFKLEANKVDEIDRLLEFCKTSFCNS